MIKSLSPKAAAIIVAISVALSAAAACARLIARDPKVPPDPPLPQAYDKAVEALGPEAKSFHCLGAGATFLSDTSGPTEWHFSFYSAEGSYREVIVSTKDKVIVRDHPRTVY